MEKESVAEGTFSDQSEISSFRHYWHVILERRWLVIIAFFLVLTLAVFYVLNATPIYLAVARLEIERLSSGLLNLGGPTLSLNYRDHDYLQTQYKNLLSRTLIQKVVNKLDLREDERYDQDDPLGAVLEDISIVPIRLSRLVDIRVQHPSSKQAAKIANTLAELFLADNLDQRKEKAWESFLWLQNEVEALEREVQNADLEVHRYRVRHAMVSLEENQNIIAQALRQAQQDHDAAKKFANDMSRLALKVNEAERDGVDVETIPYVADSKLISQLRAQLAIDQAELARLLKRYKDKFPAIIGLRQKIQNQKDSIKTEAQKVIATLKQRLAISREQESAALENLRMVEAEQHQLSEKKVEYDVLVRKAKRSKFFYELVLGEAKEMNLSSKESMQNMRIVDRATAPFKPFKPNRVLTLILSVIGGIGVGIGLAFFVNFLDDSIKSQDDVEIYLRLNLLGYVPNIRMKSVIERDLQAHLHPQSTSSEGFRTIRASVSLAHPEDSLRVTAITSTIPSEGKTLTACNYAIVTAQTGLKTLLLDTDLRRPSIHNAFQLPSPVGLTQYLFGRVASIDEITHSTELPSLDIICSGTVPTSPSELVGSEEMKSFIAEVRKKYDRIILDCPPVSAVSDPLVIASLCDSAIMVIKFNKIRRDHARRSVQRVQDAGVKIIGAIINDIDFEGRDSYYYYYCYYQNRYYASHYQNERYKEGAEKRPKSNPTMEKA
ncbi:MAG: Tyrosine-protein kinase YwqD [Verrucomicrobia subdivision 3 bacterium]|nr:Tyrosine-protein kinase YwqD [Limisphaerales bacterium]MCS1415755.1 Tyrosine-protein kinase YwqD [Limisphaerales bacterium]